MLDFAEGALVGAFVTLAIVVVILERWAKKGPTTKH